jgi:hypothetical protein
VFTTVTGGDEIEIYRMRYDPITAASHPLSTAAAQATRALRLVDRLNVGHGSDEAAHAYRAETRLGGTPLGATARIAEDPGSPRIADGGRAIVGRESFALSTVAGRDLVLVLRTAPEMEASLLRIGGGPVTLAFQPAAAILRVDGHVVGTVSEAPSGAWPEWVLRVPAGLITSSRTRFEVAGRYASFGYWAYQ